MFVYKMVSLNWTLFTSLPKALSAIARAKKRKMSRWPTSFKSTIFIIMQRKVSIATSVAILLTDLLS